MENENKQVANTNNSGERLTETRNICEMCGYDLKEPETDHRNVAICDECMKGQGMDEVMEIKKRQDMVEIYTERITQVRCDATLVQLKKISDFAEDLVHGEVEMKGGKKENDK